MHHFILTLMLASAFILGACSNYAINTDKGRSDNPANSMGHYPTSEPCAEKDPVTRLCK